MSAWLIAAAAVGYVFAAAVMFGIVSALTDDDADLALYGAGLWPLALAFVVVAGFLVGAAALGRAIVERLQ